MIITWLDLLKDAAVCTLLQGVLSMHYKIKKNKTVQNIQLSLFNLKKEFQIKMEQNASN